MTPLLSLLTSIALLTAGAADPTCAEDDPQDCRIALKSGDAAPFGGQLLSPRRAARLAVMAGQCSDRTNLAVEAAVAEVTLDLELERRLRESDRETFDLRVRVLTRALEKADEASRRGFLDHPVTWLIAGALVTAALTAGAVAIIAETRPTQIVAP